MKVGVLALQGAFDRLRGNACELALEHVHHLAEFGVEHVVGLTEGTGDAAYNTINTVHCPAADCSLTRIFSAEIPTPVASAISS